MHDATQHRKDTHGGKHSLFQQSVLDACRPGILLRGRGRQRQGDVRGTLRGRKSLKQGALKEGTLNPETLTPNPLDPKALKP